MFEFNGKLFENEIDFLDVVREEYESGNTQVALAALEEYGFDLSDLTLSVV